MRNANILKTVFVPYCKMVFQEEEGKKKVKLKMSFFNKIKWVNANSAILFLLYTL